MIFTPPGWTVIPEYGMVELVHPAGRGTAVIHYRERVRPLMRVGALVRQLLARLPGFVPDALPGAAERLVTGEGEHAALVTARGRQDGRPAQRDLGFVFGDDFYALVSGVCVEEARFAEMTALVRELIVGDRHMLGMRRRRFDYTPPPRWQPLIEGFVTEWYPPDFPNNSLRLTVYPASPSTLAPRSVFAMMLRSARRGAHVHALEKPHDLRSDSGLEGQSFGATLRGHAPGSPATTLICYILHDARYIYTLEASGRSEHLVTQRSILEQVVASIRPVPHPGGELRDPAIISHWIE